MSNKVYYIMKNRKINRVLKEILHDYKNKLTCNQVAVITEYLNENEDKQKISKNKLYLSYIC
jgi:hypothetical protein